MRHGLSKLAVLASVILATPALAMPTLDADASGSPWVARLGGAFPEPDPLVGGPVFRGSRNFLAFTLASNTGSSPFEGDIRLIIPEIGLNGSSPISLEPQRMMILPVFAEIPADAPDRITLRLTFEVEGRTVGRGEERELRVFDAGTEPCPNEVRVYAAAGAKGIAAGDAARYSYVLCNGTSVDHVVNLEFWDDDTGRPLVSARAGIGMILSRVAPAETLPAIDPYRVMVPAGQRVGMLFTLEDSPPSRDIVPIARLYLGDEATTTGRLDPVTFAPPKLTSASHSDDTGR